MLNIFDAWENVTLQCLCTNSSFPDTEFTLKYLDRQACTNIDWLQSPVTKYFFLIILFNNPLK